MRVFSSYVKDWVCGGEGLGSFFKYFLNIYSLNVRIRYRRSEI